MNENSFFSVTSKRLPDWLVKQILEDHGIRSLRVDDLKS